jgi:protein-S-isoprenylcysteine O-methyltransferase
MFVYPALIGMIFGEGLRISAFFTAKNNFTHIIRHKKTQGHKLIKSGVYSVFRHPSYTGYFYFAVCGQLFLGNFISFAGFFVALSKFFN